MTDAELAAIEARAEAATDGPWREAKYDGSHVLVPDGTARGPDGHLDYMGGVMCHRIRDADAAFVAHARTDIPALLAEVRRLRRYEPTYCQCGARKATCYVQCEDCYELRR